MEIAFRLFPPLAVRNNAAANIFMQVSVWKYIFISLEYKPTNEISGSHSNTILNILRKLPNYFPKLLYHFISTFPLAMNKGSRWGPPANSHAELSCLWRGPAVLKAWNITAIQQLYWTHDRPWARREPSWAAPQKQIIWEFPGVVWTWHFHSCGSVSIPDQETRIMQARHVAQHAPPPPPCLPSPHCKKKKRKERSPDGKCSLF